MADPIVILAAIIGLGAVADLACNVVSFLMSQPKVKTLMASTLQSLLLSPAGLAVAQVVLNAIEFAAEAVTSDPDLKKVEVFAFSVVNARVADLANPAPAPAPAS